MCLFLEVIGLKEQEAGFLYVTVEKHTLYNIVISKFNKIPFKLHV